MSPVNGKIDLPGFDASCAPAQVQNYPSMTTEGEKSLLYWLARRYFGGDGLIVDAGVLLGASTNAFATGLKENAQALARIEPGRKPIHSYDIAIWVQGMDKYLTKHATQKALKGKTPKRGASFEPILRELLRAHQPLVDLRIGDIVKTASADRPVEIAFYDCLNSGVQGLRAALHARPAGRRGAGRPLRRCAGQQESPGVPRSPFHLSGRHGDVRGVPTGQAAAARVLREGAARCSVGRSAARTARARRRAEVAPVCADVRGAVHGRAHRPRRALARLEEVEAEMKRHPIELLGTRMLGAVATLRQRVVSQDRVA